MRKKLIIACVLLCCVIVTTALAACSPAAEITLRDLSLQIAPDGSIAPLTGDNSEELLGNIDRGFRLETYYTLGSERAWPDDADSNGYDMLTEEIEYYKADNANEIQVYIYLNEYNNKPLDDYALDQLKKYFETVRELRMSMLLRFAYEFDQANLQGPNQDTMLSHHRQLKEFMRNNKELINDTVTALQFGCIGAWGEWGATANKYNEKKILDSLIDMMPENTYFQGRYMRVVNQTDKNAKSEYVGYHNDFLVGRPHPWNTAGDKYGSSDYKKFFNNAQSRLNDGEMPWGGYSEEPNEIIDGKNFIRQMTEHSMGTLSIKHNYRENRSGSEQSYNMERWKSEFITPEELEAMDCPYYPSWFKDYEGNAVKRSVYEYLRDYLGYQLMLSNLKITDTGDGAKISFVITNYGMGTPLTLDSLHLALTDGNKTEFVSVQGFDVKKLVTYGQLSLEVNVKDIQNKRIGVKISRGCSTGDYNIKTANNIPFENGVNYFN